MKKKALSLMEVLVSIIIMGLVFIGMANIFVTGKRYVLHSRYRATGGELGRVFVDPLQMQVNETQWTSNCLSDNSRCTSTSQFVDIMNYAANYATSDVTSTSLRRAIVNLTWNETTP